MANAAQETDRLVGLLAHEDFAFAQFPPHLAFRQYWRDFDSLEAWTRRQPHRDWWRNFLADPKALPPRPRRTHRPSTGAAARSGDAAESARRELAE